MNKASSGERVALLELCVEWLREATPGTSLETTDLVDYLLEHGVRAGQLSARPECVEAAMLGYVRFPNESHEKRIKHALEAAEVRAAERAAGGENALDR